MNEGSKQKSVINVIGLGYIGLPTAATLANAGFEVLGVDVRPEIIAKINAGNIHIQEPGLDILVRAAFQRGNLRAAAEPSCADAFIIAVPTPIHADKSPDLRFVEAATETIASVLQKGNLIIVESTVPPRTCLDVVAPLIERLTGLKHGADYDLAHCPERVIPGRILTEIIQNDRIVGGTTPAATQRTAALYASFVKGKILETDATTAEMCKLMENSFRDVNIALANELANIAEDLQIDIHEAIALANRHPRVHIHTPGIGVGGHCIPVDPWFIAHVAPDKSPLIRTARNVNDARPHALAERILAAHRERPHAEIAFFGLSYKPDVDDTRESPAIEVVRRVAESVTRTLWVIEPNISALPEELKAFPHVFLGTEFSALEHCAILVGLVNHSPFRVIDPDLLTMPTIYDEEKTIFDDLRIWKNKAGETL